MVEADAVVGDPLLPLPRTVSCFVEERSVAAGRAPGSDVYDGSMLMSAVLPDVLSPVTVTTLPFPGLMAEATSRLRVSSGARGLILNAKPFTSTSTALKPGLPLWTRTTCREASMPVKVWAAALTSGGGAGEGTADCGAGDAGWGWLSSAGPTWSAPIPMAPAWWGPM